MKKFFLFVFSAVLITACNTATPEDYFDQAVLSTNTVNGFENDGLMQELVQPSNELKEGTKDQIQVAKRKEMLDIKTQYAEKSFARIKALKPTDDTKEMIDASISLFEYVLPVYKNEYAQMAKLYDDGAPEDQIKALGLQIHEKYGEGYAQRIGKLISIGKAYADKHNIKVQWGMNGQ